MNMNLLNILKNINLNSIISNTNKTLKLVKKSIPVYKEIRPYINKEKSIFKRETDENIDEIKMSKPLKQEKDISYNDSLTFFN